MASPALIEKYKQLLINLLPPGRLWQPREQPTFDKQLKSTAQELCRVDDRVRQMRLEIDPRTTTETIETWEEIMKLPDECTPLAPTLDERRTQIVNKLITIRGLSKTFYEFIAAQFGFTITVENYLNFVAGRARAGDRLTNFFNRHFVAGSTAGERLTEIGWRYYFNVDADGVADDELICLITKLKPAHAGVTFIDY